MVGYRVYFSSLANAASFPLAFERAKVLLSAATGE
jgi:hypothetical protein